MRTILVAVMICAATLATALLSVQAADTAAQRADVQVLAGRWVRPDGGYILQLSHVGNDGTLSASYFNPRPIRVHQASYRVKQGKITVYVELRDANYPGSYYQLEYDHRSDRLRGTYFQAVERQTYQILFERVK